MKKTATFYKNGGFNEYYNRKEKENEENNQLKKLQFENIKLQNDNLLYQKKIRNQEEIIRLWKLLTAISGIIGLILSLFFLFFCK